MLAAYTYTSGLRAPALIAFVKDALIYLVIIVAVIYLPAKFGGLGHIFDAAQTKMATTNPATGKPTGSFIPGRLRQARLLGLRDAGARLGDGAVHVPALDHRRRSPPRAATTIRRNAAILPAYSFVLGLLALLGLGGDRGRHQADRARTASPTRSW